MSGLPDMRQERDGGLKRDLDCGVPGADQTMRVMARDSI
jgi:hypothetical protein